MSKLTLVLSSILALLSLTACNTMRGIGQDIERGGSAIERAATR